MFERVYSQGITSNTGFLTKRYELHVDAERLLVQEGSKRMLFRISRPGFDDSIATDTLIEREGGFDERASAYFGLWHPVAGNGLFGSLNMSKTSSVLYQGERLVLTMDISSYSMQGGHSLNFECLADSARGPVYSSEGQVEGIQGTFSSTTLKLRSFNGKPIDADSLRTLFHAAP